MAMSKTSKLCETCASATPRFGCMHLDCAEHGYPVYPTETCPKHKPKDELKKVGAKRSKKS